MSRDQNGFLESKGHLQQLKNAPGEVATLKGTAVCSGLVRIHVSCAG